MDLHICFRMSDDEWTDPINLGTNINSINYDYGGSISPDSNYLFFTKWGATSAPDIYWVNTEQVWRLKPYRPSLEPRHPPGRAHPGTWP